ncbi:MAG TPA: permease prefix domain 1-containing protein [Anaerolineales bacterium]|nr:permease prefix domain 1-containing protein [Anaerolineales bacterium]
MNLIERYIAAVGRYLPEKERGDIEAEIRSMLEDMIDERNQQTGKPVHDEVVVAVLEELGDPKLLAQKYAPAKRYLIGPDWYEAYVETLKRVLATALPAVAIVTFSLALAPDRSDVTAAVEQAFGRVIDVAIGILFWVLC